ncbi:FAD-binding oxidoreductase [Spirochaeta isovalerica]|uniref:Delta(24)-sterol reductase n=1 Tax=Spirochaeta isovalerica TaxID=150 RepID=A0A841RF54_9SPIO|nr:FAD-binding oxidoreductase [Spirochaeta isovalerica]MBB6481847.1 delta24-sterol reductase [Spirochaeta isovalerica]
MPQKSAIENWIDNHRELLLLTIILPWGKLFSWKDRLISFLTRPDPKDHEKRVHRVVSDVRRLSRQAKELRTDRRGNRSLTTRISDKSQSQPIGIRDLRSVVSIDEAGMTVRVEPFATIGDVVSHLDKKGYQLETAIEMKGATIGGLVLAIGMTTKSHITGLMHDIVEAYEIVTAEGELLRVTKEGEHADLFRAIPWSHGTLGFLVAIEMRIIPATPYVRLVYRPFYSLETYCEEHSRLLHSDNPPTYLEAQVFGRNKAVIIEGYPAGKEEAGDFPVNDVNSWHKPFFFKHVESMLELGEGRDFSELVPLTSFLMRHERSMCMTMGQIVPSANNVWFRRFFGWTLPPNMPLLKSSRPTEERERSMKRQVYQDFAFPSEHLQGMLEHLHDEFEIYPLLIYPCRVFDRGGMVRLPGQRAVEWDGTERSALYFNIGIYGEPKAVREGNFDYPTVNKVREIEQKISDLGGFLHTYVDIFSTKEEFEAMFDHSLWRKMRQKYGAEGVFPEIYDKVKPELDPLQFVR